MSGVFDKSGEAADRKIVFEFDAAKPAHVLELEKALSLDRCIAFVDRLFQQCDGNSEFSDDNEQPPDLEHRSSLVNGTDAAEDHSHFFNLSNLKKSKRWLKMVLLSDNSSDDEVLSSSTSQFRDWLWLHKRVAAHKLEYRENTELRKFRNYSRGILTIHETEKFPKPLKRKAAVDATRASVMKGNKRMKRIDGDDFNECSAAAAADRDASPSAVKGKAGTKPKALTLEQSLAKRKRVWQTITKKEIAKAAKQKSSSKKEVLANCKKIAMQCMRRKRRDAVQSIKNSREVAARMKRVTREMTLYWKRFDKVERQQLKKAQKEAEEQRRLDLELLEARRQQRKLNYLITQTELYAHFMSKKLSVNAGEADCDKILRRLEEPSSAIQPQKQIHHGVLVDLEEDYYDHDEAKLEVLRNAEAAHRAHQQKIDSFDRDLKFIQRGNLGLSNPNIEGFEYPQPSIFEGKLKSYQLKGMSWLINLYNQGINGILADEMGLGKTVQSIAFLSHLAESQNIWGPFLIVAPASTLHNWQQECERFVPKMKAIPYWGNAVDRKNLRKYWEQQHLHTERASFHIVITSYQLVIQDVKYFQKIKWHYMVLDEAQALKSSSSTRWRTLLDFNCRNRLLLTGTPIQNSMAELWALLHFIMPTLFDSHEEFNEWFSKDIENHVEKQSGIDESQLSRLHMILKPFMLRRVKKDVENELSDKIEILVYCPLTSRQKLLYQAIKNKIRIEDLLQTSSATASQNTTNSLMNLVMQFRKVCNHPELFERREARSSFFMKLDPYHVPKLIYREGMRWLIEPSKLRLLQHLSVFNSINGFKGTKTGEAQPQLLGFASLMGLSPNDVCDVMSRGLVALWNTLFYAVVQAYKVYHWRTWHDGNSRNSSRHMLLLEPDRPTHFASIESSQWLKEIVFVNPTSICRTFNDQIVHFMAETAGHRRMRLKRLHDLSPTHRQPALRSPTSPTLGVQHKSFLSPKKLVASHADFVQASDRTPQKLSCEITDIPRFLLCTGKRAAAGCHTTFCSDRSAEWEFEEARSGGPPELRTCLMYGNSELRALHQSSRSSFCSVAAGGLAALETPGGFSSIFLPDKDALIKDAGKMRVLDDLLTKLKCQGHRVLIYSTMTRIIDLLEEFMWYRKHSYMRLDGSSKIADRRDMVSDFQTKTDIFAFLLSTRAGGLGINLTAADTVIFYDSDWNPTVDQQAMDRAHRLGQTKQVTVYRLVCKGTIEERILQRAREKSEIQRVVISGGNFRPDLLKPKEVVSLLIDDDEIEKKFGYMSKKQNVGEKPADLMEFQSRKSKVISEMEGSNDDESVNIDDEVGINIAALCNSPSELSRDSAATGNGPLDKQGAVTASSSPGGSSAIDDAGTPLLRKKRGRGRPKGQSGKPRKTQQPRAGVKKVLSAAEIAGAQAGLTAAYAAYGYNITTNPSTIGTPSGTIQMSRAVSTLSAPTVLQRKSSKSALPKSDV